MIYSELQNVDTQSSSYKHLIKFVISYSCMTSWLQQCRESPFCSPVPNTFHREKKPAMAPSVTRKTCLRFCRPKGKRKGPGAAASWIPATLGRSPTIQDGWRAGHESGVYHHFWQAGKGCEAMEAFRPEGDRAVCPQQSPRRQLHRCRKVSGATAGKSALKGVL